MPSPLSAAKRLKKFERAVDTAILPQLYIVARLDGRGFSNLIRDRGFEKPFDVRFRDAMVATTRHLMDTGPRAVLGYVQSDEISLLIHPACTAFGRRSAKLLSILAGEGSAVLSLELGFPAVLDCRLSLLPTRPLVRDYFRWRIADAVRNGLNGMAYWALRGTGATAADTTARLNGMSRREKHDLLHRLGQDFDGAPDWQKQGMAVHWAMVDVQTAHPLTGEPTTATRRRLVVEPKLPRRDALDAWLDGHIPDQDGTERQ